MYAELCWVSDTDVNLHRGMDPYGCERQCPQKCMDQIE